MKDRAVLTRDRGKFVRLENSLCNSFLIGVFLPLYTSNGCRQGVMTLDLWWP